MSSVRLILPYVVEDMDRKKTFTNDMEVATTLCLAEARRKKLGILGASPEEISFISKLYYPLWAVPWEDSCLIEDGLGILSYTVVYMKLPDVKLFVEDIERSTTVRELYRNTLKSHAQTFKDFVAAAQISMDSIVANRELLSTILEYVNQVAPQNENATESLVSAPPKLNEEAVLEKAEKIIDHWRQIRSEIRSLEYAINILDEQTRFHEQKILREMEQIQEMYEGEILRIKPVVEKIVERLMTERDAKILKVVKGTERKLKALLKDRDGHERKLQRLERSRADFDKRRETRRRRGDKTGETYWNREVRRCQGQISEVQREIQEVSQLIEHTRKEGEVAVKTLYENYQTMIDRERKRILELEDSRDSVIELKTGEIKELRSEASSIINLIGQLLEQKRLHASKLQEVTIPWKLEEVTLICVPFYLIRYKADAKSRYEVYTPVVAMGYEGILKKVQRTLRSFSLESRIKLLLRPRSRAFKETLASVFVQKMREDKAFEEVIYDMGCSNNLFNIPNFSEMLGRGMEELKNEGWVSPEEKDAILNTYAPH